MSIRQTIVNLNPSDGVPAVRVNQYDLGVTLVFVVLDGTAPADFPSGTTCTLQGTRPSGTGYSIACQLADNIATIDTTIEMTREYGDSTCELRFVRNGTDMGTGNFKLGVEKAAFANDTIDENTNHWNALAQQVHADTVVATADALTAAQAAQDSTEAKEITLKAEQSALLAARRTQDYLQTVKQQSEAATAAAEAAAASEDRLTNALDSTLTQEGHPADAAAVGRNILHASFSGTGLVLTTGMG